MYRLCLMWLFVFAAAATLVAQAPTGTITGTVSDESGAVVPSAKVAIVNRETGFRRDVASGVDGSFSAAALPAGDYEVRAEAAGFRILLRPAIVETGATTS